MAKKIVQEFKEFINRGNVVDLAVGVIVGGAFTTIVNSLVNDVVNPLISFLTGGSNEMTGLTVDLGGSVIDFGAFVGAVVNFLITAVVVFAIVKALNKAQKLGQKVVPGFAGRGGEGKDGDKGGAAASGGAAPTAPDGGEPQRVCPYCRQEIDPQATRCPHCTSKLEGYTGP